MKKKIVIIGAGMAGCFMAVCMAKRGYDVDVFEYRPDVRKEDFDSGRSFNLTLYYRGIKAMKQIGVWDEAKKIAVIAEGNAAHYGEKKIVYDAFDAGGNEILYTVHRNHLNAALITSTEKYPNITMHFNTKCVAIDSNNRTVTVQKNGEKTTKEIAAEIVIGADGVNSAVRSYLEKKFAFTAVKEFEKWGYKEVHISPELTVSMNLRTEATHTWPREDSLLIAFPNPNNSFTLMFNLPLEGKKSLASLTSKESIEKFIYSDFPDLTPLLPEIIEAFHNRPTGTFVTLHNKTWHDESFAVLVGDAAHAVIPFYGQGMCAAFEDCLKFVELLDERKEDWKKIFPLYQASRKRNTDILAVLSKENFVELRDKSRSPFFLFKNKADTLLHTLFPKFWQPPLYVLIAHGDLEYHEAVRRYKRQQELSKKIGLDLALQTLALPVIAANRIKRK